MTAGADWGTLSGSERAEILDRAGDVLEARRAELVEVMASEAGKTLDQADPEISEAIDFANYYADLAGELDTVDGARFEPRLTVVTPPWNFPVAIPAGSTAGGAGGRLGRRHQAGRAGGTLRLGHGRGALGGGRAPRRAAPRAARRGRPRAQLVSDPRVDRLILTGAYETAELFRSFRPDLPLLAETSGKNAIIVTPSADLDLAVKDVVYSAFGHAGPEVLGRVAGDPGRLGRHLAAVPRPARRRRRRR